MLLLYIKFLARVFALHAVDRMKIVLPDTLILFIYVLSPLNSFWI